MVITAAGFVSSVFGGLGGTGIVTVGAAVWAVLSSALRRSRIGASAFSHAFGSSLAGGVVWAGAGGVVPGSGGVVSVGFAIVFIPPWKF